MALCRNVIANAYEAFWFIFSHPKFTLRERTPINAQQADELKGKGYLVSRDRGGQCWREWRHVVRHAICTNLDISYVKENDNSIADEEETEKADIECKIEFGNEEYGYFRGEYRLTSSLNFAVSRTQKSILTSAQTAVPNGATRLALLLTEFASGKSFTRAGATQSGAPGILKWAHLSMAQRRDYFFSTVELGVLLLSVGTPALFAYFLSTPQVTGALTAAKYG